jgi:hypothetical protein
VAGSFEDKIFPSKSFDTIASSEFSTIAARYCVTLPAHLAVPEPDCAVGMEDHLEVET